MRGVRHEVKESEFRRQETGDRRKDTRYKMQREDNFGFRIAKPGTRPKGGSPKDNCEFKNQDERSRMSLFVCAYPQPSRLRRGRGKLLPQKLLLAGTEARPTGFCLR